MGKHNDQVWQLVYRYPDGKRWSCPHCRNSFAGGASRVKFHLAKIPFQDIAICERVPQECQGIAYALIPAKVLRKIAIAGWQYLVNASIQGVHNPAAGQYSPDEVLKWYSDYLLFNDAGWQYLVNGVHNPAAGQYSLDEVLKQISDCLFSDE